MIMPAFLESLAHINIFSMVGARVLLQQKHNAVQQGVRYLQKIAFFKRVNFTPKMVKFTLKLEVCGKIRALVAMRRPGC